MKRAVAKRSHPVLECEHGVVAGGHALEAEAGARMLEQGGNAVDAAVAAAFAGFVVEQVDCGLGGFAHVSVLSPAHGFVSFDGYVQAPGAARADMFEARESDGPTYYGHPPTAGYRAKHGAMAVAVPGAVAALCDAHAADGALPLAAVLEPAIEAAEAGVPFSWRDALVIGKLRSRIRELPDAAAVLLPGGRIPRTPVQEPSGDRMDGTPLARTLRAIADGGKAAFYAGDIAEAIAAHVQRRGGILTAADLAGYEAVVAHEAPGRFRGHDYVTCLDTVGYEALGILDGLELGALDPDGWEYRHWMAEALGVAFTDSLVHYGDPAFVDSPVSGLRSPGFAAARRRQLARDRALPRPIAPGDPWPYDGRAKSRSDDVPTPSPAERGGTSQMVAADRDGRMVSIVTAVGWDYGALCYVPEAGVFLNNGMSYFDPRPGRPSSIAPGKRPMFGAPALAMAKDGGARLACAGSGGYRIQSAVLHSAINTLDHGMDPSDAVDHPRVHCQGGETYVDARIPEDVRRRLAEAGHDVVTVQEDAATLHFARACLVERDPRGHLRASAAPHWLSAVAGV